MFGKRERRWRSGNKEITMRETKEKGEEKKLGWGCEGKRMGEGGEDERKRGKRKECGREKGENTWKSIRGKEYGEGEEGKGKERKDGSWGKGDEGRCSSKEELYHQT